MVVVAVILPKNGILGRLAVRPVFLLFDEHCLKADGYPIAREANFS